VSRIRRLRPYAALWIVVILFDGYFMRSVVQTGFSATTIGLQIDAPVYVWFNAWVAHALFSFNNPFLANVSSIGHPFNLLAFASNAGFAILYSPLTKVLGAVATFNIQLMTIPFVNGSAMVACVRRLRGGALLAFGAGVLWALNPFVVHSMLSGWTDVGYQVTMPLVVVLYLATFRDKELSSRAGLLLIAGAVIFQYLVSQEALFDDLIFAGLVALIVWIRRPRLPLETPFDIRATMQYFVAPVIIILGPLTVYAIVGPSSLSNLRVPSRFIGHDQVLGTFFRPFHYGSGPSPINPYYVGALLCAFFLWASWSLRRKPLVVAVSVASVVSWFFSLQYRNVAGVPLSRLIESLPIVGNLSVSRFIFQFWFGATTVIVLWLASDTSRRVSRNPRRVTAAVLGGVTLVSSMVGVLHLSPPLAMGYPKDSAIEHIVHSTERHVVATFPFPFEHRSMWLQAENGDFSYHLADIYTYAIFGQFPALQRDKAVFTEIHKDQLLSAPSRRQLDLGRVALRQMGVTDVVLPRGSIASVGPGAQTDVNTNEFVALFTEMLGMPSVLDGEWVWRHLGQSHHSMKVLSTAQWRTCALRTAAGRIPKCVVQQP